MSVASSFDRKTDGLRSEALTDVTVSGGSIEFAGCGSWTVPVGTGRQGELFDCKETWKKVRDAYADFVKGAPAGTEVVLAGKFVARWRESAPWVRRVEYHALCVFRGRLVTRKEIDEAIWKAMDGHAGAQIWWDDATQWSMDLVVYLRRRQAAFHEGKMEVEGSLIALQRGDVETMRMISELTAGQRSAGADASFMKHLTERMRGFQTGGGRN